MKEIFLIRHGRQCSKLCNVDVALDDVGRQQAVLAGKRLVSYRIYFLYIRQHFTGNPKTCIDDLCRLSCPDQF